MLDSRNMITSSDADSFIALAKRSLKALADCDEAIRCSPNNPIGFLTRGYVRYVSNDLIRR